MPQTYFPTVGRSIDVPASPPHAPGTTYRVSFGHEQWIDGSYPVGKVQMVYNGVVSGRRSPSFPEGTDDYFRVLNAFSTLNAGR
jgi:hypothetical protein